LAGKLPGRSHEADYQRRVESGLPDNVREQQSTRDVVSADRTASLRHDTGRDGQAAVRQLHATAHHQTGRRYCLNNDDQLYS